MTRLYRVALPLNQQFWTELRKADNRPSKTARSIRTLLYKGERVPQGPSHFEIGPKAQGFSIYERNGRKRLTLRGPLDQQFRNTRKYDYR